MVIHTLADDGSADTAAVFGTTTNPHNTNLTPGGSTGGEGALIALRGSMFGFGGSHHTCRHQS